MAIWKPCNHAVPVIPVTDFCIIQLKTMANTISYARGRTHMATGIFGIEIYTIPVIPVTSFCIIFTAPAFTIAYNIRGHSTIGIFDLEI